MRLATREVDIVGLLSAGQYLHPTGPRPSLAAVRDYYEGTIRPSDASMPPWADVVTGATLDDADRSVHALALKLG